MIVLLLVSCGVFMSNYGKTEENLTIAFENTGNLQPGAARSAIPGTATQALLEYGITLTRGAQTRSAVVPAGQTSAVLSVTPGVWNIAVEAYLPPGTYAGNDSPIHVGTGSAQVTVVEGQSASAAIKMIFDNTTPESVEVVYMGTTYAAAYIGDNIYAALLTTYGTTETVAITINKAVPDQVIVDGSDIEITGPVSVLSPADRGNTVSTSFTVKANDLEGFMAPYDVKLIFGWPVDTTASAMDLKARFSITTTGANGVTEAFNAVHWLINTPEAGDFTQIIQLGDYIDLDSLNVADYNSAGAISEVNTTWGGDHGQLLRLIVVGKNSFNGINGNNTPHVVFQFQNLPGTRKMNASDTNAGGYMGSEMKAYLTPDGVPGHGNFYTGLTGAGVPDAVVWAPSRRVANGGSGATGADTVADLLWLPTEFEMSGAHLYSSPTYEAPATQARLEYYTDNNSRIKYGSSNSDRWYWLASPYYGNAADFSVVSEYGDPGYVNASATLDSGVVPAFCVK
ncbi:MAG: DUF6273 domain-containing protein [Spirochaetaceae bacterium]|nr:DUF6273 domain-containing protein [Spirochaetaceae bacterium]